MSIWENTVGDDERLVYGVSLKRSYRDGDSWKESKAFRPQDLPHLAIALNEAYLWIQSQNSKQ